MPSPVTSELPRPRSWDEFEDICADVLRYSWGDPYIKRHGRSGQQQFGVDIYGQPAHLGGSDASKYAGAQCKLTNSLDFRIVQAEVEKAKEFLPKLSEYIIMTTAPRDSQVLQEIRIAHWPFRTEIRFWEDICLDLSSHDDLLKKHFPGWMNRTVSERQVLDIIRASDPKDYKYDDNTGVLFYRFDIVVRIILDRSPISEREFSEPWVKRFPDSYATYQPVYVYYRETKVLDLPCVYVDGGRYIIPLPRSVTELTITSFAYHIGRILNHHIPGLGLDFALVQAGIHVVEEK